MKLRLPQIDWLLFLFILPVLGAGLITMKSFTDVTPYFSHQLIWIGISFIVFFALSYVDFRFLKRTEILVGAFIFLFHFVFCLATDAPNALPENRRKAESNGNSQGNGVVECRACCLAFLFLQHGNARKILPSCIHFYRRLLLVFTKILALYFVLYWLFFEPRMGTEIFQTQ